jgi:hypothetical protein
MDQARPIIFLHVPKTGGATLVDIARRQFPAAAVVALPDSLAGARAALAQRPEDDRRHLRFLHGHVPFGAHSAMPGPVHHVTLLRHPVARMVSVYHYARRRPEWDAHRAIHGRGLTLERFVESDAAAEFNDAQTRFLAGSDEPVHGPAALAQAVRHLDGEVAVVGITERFDESLLVCGRRFGWQRLHYVRQNVNRRRPALADVPPRAVALIERRNALDLELYAAGERALDAALAAMPSVAEEVRRFRAVNRVYDGIGTAATFVRQIARRGLGR